MPIYQKFFGKSFFIPQEVLLAKLLTTRTLKTEIMRIYKETIILLNTTRTGYSIKQVLDKTSTLTVQELIDYLSDFDPESPILFSNDNGYMFGEIDEDSFEEIEIEKR